jgi:hypothetical protein
MKNDKYPIGNFGTAIFGLLFVGSIIIIPIFFTLDENRKLKICNNNYEDIKNIYLGTSHMGNLKGRAKCEIYKKSNDAILTYEFSGYRIRNEIGEIKIDAGGYGKFECNNGNCNYDILLDDSTLTIIGNNWGCNLKKVSK